MERIRLWWPSFVLGICLMLALLITHYRPVLYGGYEGLLYQSIQDLVGKDEVAFSGELTIQPDKEVAWLSLDFHLEGYKASEEGIIGEVYTVMPGTSDRIAAGRITAIDDALFLVLDGEEEQTISLTELLDLPKALSDDEAWSGIYEGLTPKPLITSDPRYTSIDVKKDMIAYDWDLSKNLSMDALTSINELVPTSESSFVGRGRILVDLDGTLVAIAFDGTIGSISVSGLLTFKSYF